MLADITERYGSFHMPEVVRALPHDLFGPYVARLHAFQHSVPGLPITFFVRYGMSSSSDTSSLHLAIEGIILYFQNLENDFEDLAARAKKFWVVRR